MEYEVGCKAMPKVVASKMVAKATPKLEQEIQKELEDVEKKEKVQKTPKVVKDGGDKSTTA